MRLLVLIPAFNEAATIGTLIRRIPRKVNGVDVVKICVVDDGSIDQTAQKAEEAGADFIVRHSVNSGVGQAFRDGINKALEMKADFILNIDADGQHNPNDIPKLISPILLGECDVVVGSRFLNASNLNMPLIKDIGNRFFTRLVSWITGVHFTDTQSGFRAFSREAALRLNTFGKFTYTQESLIQLAMNGLRIKEIPITVTPRNGKSKVVKNWYSYGIKAITIMLRSVRDFKPLIFFAVPGIIALLAAFSMGTFTLIHWLLTGRTFPYTSLIDFTIFSSLSGGFLLLLALLADMQGRQRRVQEETLYYVKRLNYEKIMKDNCE
jgi:glycosyltransferase involved in cell wall biosynthesis